MSPETYSTILLVFAIILVAVTGLFFLKVYQTIRFLQKIKGEADAGAEEERWKWRQQTGVQGDGTKDAKATSLDV